MLAGLREVPQALEPAKGPLTCKFWEPTQRIPKACREGEVCVIFRLLSRYMRPVGPWQRRWLFYISIFLRPQTDRTDHSRVPVSPSPRFSRRNCAPKKQKGQRKDKRKRCILGWVQPALLSFALAVLLLLPPGSQRSHFSHPRVPEEGRDRGRRSAVSEHDPHRRPPGLSPLRGTASESREAF